MLFCDSKHEEVNKGSLYFWIYCFYLSKYYELLDTVILCLRKVRHCAPTLVLNSFPLTLTEMNLFIVFLGLASVVHLCVCGRRCRVTNRKSCASCMRTTTGPR